MIPFPTVVFKGVKTGKRVCCAIHCVQKKGESENVPPISFQRGIRLPLNKEPAASRGIEPIKALEKAYIPLICGSARSCQPALGAYEAVMRGDVLGKPDKEGDSPAIATVSGVFSDIREIHHPLCGDITCAVVECMVPGAPAPKKGRATDDLTPQNIIDIACQTGIIDELDGVPLYMKLQECLNAPCDLVVAHAVEAEPYASSAWAVLNESGEEAQQGLRLAARAAGASGSHFAVRLPAARRRPLMQRLGEEQLYQVSGRYPVTKFTRAGGAVCLMGVQACLALYRAAAYGEAHCDAVITVAGDAVSNPRNIRVPFGTTVADVLETAGLSADPAYIILGDAMTGTATENLDIPVLPGITCILALTKRQVIPSRPCIGCGRCAQVCHAGLLPYEIIRRLENMHYERLVSLHPEECDGCGACSHVCPAGREVTARVLEAGQSHGTIFLNWGDDDDA